MPECQIVKEQLLLTFKGSDFIGLIDESFYEIRDYIGTDGIVDLIASTICWQVDHGIGFDPETGRYKVSNLEDSILLIFGYRTLQEVPEERRVELDDKIVQFVMNRVKAIGYMIPDALVLDYRNRKVYFDEKSDTVYLIVEYEVA